MANYEVEILVRGKPVKMFRHKGEFYVEGRKGSTFELKLTNNTWKNIEIVPSVDGLSVLDGEACGEDSEGYLVSARDSVTIPGWRLNNQSVAEFIFKDKNRSYAEQSGEGTTNVGVIGFMVFKEKEYAYTPPFHPYPYQPFYASGSFTVRGNSDDIITNTATAKSATSVESLNICSNTIAGDSVSSTHVVIDDSIDDKTFNIGTGWGDEVEHNVTVVDFERMNPTVADSLITVYYDTRKGLEARGIKVVKQRRYTGQELPDPFPTYTQGCKPPTGWKSKDANWDRLKGPRKRR